MPVDQKKYPKNWKAISEEVRKRSGGQCECTGECGLHRTTGGPRRCVERNGETAKWAKGKVVLTTAHMCHDARCSKRHHLKAMCQRCHNRYDVPFRKLNRFRNRIHGDVEARVLARGKFTDDCWTWTGTHSPEGYGRVRIDGISGFVHRFMVSWILGRPLQTNEHIDHLCRVRDCFRPSHLELVTPQENSRRGAKTKISMLQVAQIREMRSKRIGVKEIGLIFGIHHSHVSRIARGIRPINKNHRRERKERETGQERLF